MSVETQASGVSASTSPRVPDTTNDEVRILSGLLNPKLSPVSGWPQLTGSLEPNTLNVAAAVLAVSIVSRRIGVTPRLYKLWRTRWLAPRCEAIDDRDRKLFEAGLLQNLGTPDEPSPLEQLHGLVAESIWHEVASEIDAGLGLPVRVEGHDWSVTDPGGDGLTVYETSDGGFCFRLWESKHHGTNKPVRRTVNAACTQVQSRALPYLSRFSLIAQQITDDDALARFYGALAERWVDRDPAAGVGISVGTDSNANVSDCFGKVDTYFEMELDKHQAQLHLVADYANLADRVRKEIWRGCGLWTEP